MILYLYFSQIKFNTIKDYSSLVYVLELVNLMRNLLILFLNTLLFSSPLKVGEHAPEFKLYDQDNKLHNLKDYRGEKLVIYFFPKAETPGWIKQACGFRDEFQNFSDFDISILGISFDSKSSLKKFKEKYNLPFNFLSDSKKTTGSAYKVNKYYFFPSRKTFLIDENGILVHIFDEVNIHSHPEDILKFFNEQKMED